MVSDSKSLTGSWDDTALSRFFRFPFFAPARFELFDLRDGLLWIWSEAMESDVSIVVTSILISLSGVLSQ